MLTLLRRGDVAVDIGANTGYFTLVMSDVVGPRGRVLAFEPIQSTFDFLSLRIDTDAWFSNVTLVRGAVGDVEGAARMFVPGGDSAQASLARHKAGSWEHAEAVTAHDVPTIRLDDYLSATGTGRVDVVKIDVEGAELAALRGMQATLAAFRPLLCLELYAEWTRGFGYEPRDVIGWLRNAGYDRWFVLGHGVQRVEVGELYRLAEMSSLDVVCADGRRHAERIAGLAALSSGGTRTGGPADPVCVGGGQRLRAGLPS